MWNAECKMIVFPSEMIEIIGVADTIHSALCIMNSALQRICAAKLNDNLSDYFKNCDIYVFPLYDLAEEC